MLFFIQQFSFLNFFLYFKFFFVLKYCNRDKKRLLEKMLVQRIPPCDQNPLTQTPPTHTLKHINNRGQITVSQSILCCGIQRKKLAVKNVPSFELHFSSVCVQYPVPVVLLHVLNAGQLNCQYLLIVQPAVGQAVNSSDISNEDIYFAS